MGRLAVLISGRGSNLQALIDAIEIGKLDAKIVLVISDRPGALGLSRAEKAGIRQSDPWEGEETHAYFEKMVGILQEAQVDLVILAGFMRLLSANLIRAFPPIINIHPSLLPAFRLGAQRKL